jgi:hypothetical protein
MPAPQIPMGPPVTPPAPADGGMDWKQALALLIPMTVAGISGGKGGLGGFGEGYAHGRALYDEMDLRKRAQQTHEQALQWDQGRDLVGDQRYDEERKRREAADIMALLQESPGWAQKAIESAMGANAADPADYGRKQYEEILSALEGVMPQIGPHKGALRAAAGDFGVLASSAKVRRFGPIYDRLTKGIDQAHYEALLASDRPIVEGMTFRDLDAMMAAAGHPFVAEQKPESASYREWQDYKREGGPLSFDQYMTMDANRKRPVTNIQTPGSLPTATQRRVDATSRSYESVAVVKNMQKVAEAIEFANQLDPNTKNPADDQALIYNFAKAMDPDSVVREGEYAVVQKYAQSWAEKFGFDVKRLYSNSQFLTPAARANMKATITAKGKAAHSQYLRVRQQYADKINRITGNTDGDEYLIDFGVMMPSSAAPSPAKGGSMGLTYEDYLKSRKGGQ